MCGLVSYALWICMCFFGMKDVMLYASVCESIDASVEYVFNEVKT